MLVHQRVCITLYHHVSPLMIFQDCFKPCEASHFGWLNHVKTPLLYDMGLPGPWRHPKRILLILSPFDPHLR